MIHILHIKNILRNRWDKEYLNGSDQGADDLADGDIQPESENEPHAHKEGGTREGQGKDATHKTLPANNFRIKKKKKQFRHTLIRKGPTHRKQNSTRWCEE